MNEGQSGEDWIRLESVAGGGHLDDNLSPVAAFSRNKWVRLILVLDAMAVVVFLIFVVMNAMKTSVLYLDVTPVDAKILVNGNEYTNGSYKVMPGSYKIEILHEGMATKTFEMDLAGDTIANVTTFLVGEDGGFSFYELRDNYGSYMKLAEIASADDNKTTDQDVSAEEFVAEYQEQLDLYMSGMLPIRYEDYEDTDDGMHLKEAINIRLGEDDECKKILCLKVSMLFTNNKDTAQKLLADNGFKVADYEVIYKVY